MKTDKLKNAVSFAFGGKLRKDPGLMFYYGDRQDIPARLKRIFGYEI